MFPGTPGPDLIYGTEDADTIDGQVGNDRLFGFGGNDTINGGDGNDDLHGGTGSDTMTGGLGNDNYDVDDVGDLVIESTNGGFDLVFTSINYTLPDNVERLAAYDAASTTPLTLTGNTLGNEIIGNEGANLLIGGGGADLLRGAGGDDTYIVDSADDRADETFNGGYDTVLFAGATSNTVHNNWDYSLIRLGFRDDGREIEHIGVYDRTSTNVVNLQGSLTKELITGNEGINYLDGRGGGDTFVGYGGDDVYFVYSTADIVMEEASDGIDTVFFLGNVPFYTLPDNIERTASVARFGGDYTRIGNSLDNEMSGNAGINTLDGKEGSDLLIGYAGDDIFRFTTALGPNNIDHLPDYAAQLDRIELDHNIFSALSLGRQSSGLHRGTGADLQAQNPDDHLLYDTQTGNLYYDADANGAGAAVLFAVLHEGLIISAADIVVI